MVPESLFHSKQPISALVVVYTGALDVLLLERADFPDYWQSVTGSCEPGERIKETALRELREETGINATPFGGVVDWQRTNRYEIYEQWRHRYAPGTTHNTEHVFGLQVPHAVPVTLNPREHLQYRWLPWEDAAALCFSSSNRAAILTLPARIERNRS
jgi:dATP pyrophosphohydrolase